MYATYPVVAKANQINLVDEQRAFRQLLHKIHPKRNSPLSAAILTTPFCLYSSDMMSDPISSCMIMDHGLSQHCLLIRNAAYFNREGATKIITGDLDGGIERLFDALETLALAGGLLPSQAILSAYYSRSFPFEQDMPRFKPQCSQQENPLLNTSPCCNVNDGDDGAYFVYSNPFVFHPVAVDTPEYATNCASVVLFNLGLALHQRGRKADSRSLYRARSMYDMSLQLVSTMSYQAASANLKVAGTNNKAHVQFEVSDVGDAKNTLHTLLNILGAKSSPPPFDEEEIEKFYMNILHLSGSTLAGAA
jgi:hypothetical protein